MSRVNGPTVREQQVLEWIAQGFNSDQIAAKMHLSPKTVNIYRGVLLRKAGAANTVRLLRVAIERKWLPKKFWENGK